MVVGFSCICVDRNGMLNLFVCWGVKGVVCSFGFNGYIDVVFLGDIVVWMYLLFLGY